jgi:hypothetical protein
MRIRFTVGVAGARFDYAPEEVVDLRADIAKGFIRQGVAVPADAPIETAVTAAPETAARRPQRRRGLGSLFGRS